MQWEIHRADRQDEGLIRVHESSLRAMFIGLWAYDIAAYRFDAGHM